MKLSPTSGHPYQALAAAVAAKIAAGELKPDDRLPAIRSLAKEYGVTVATAQRAVQHLVQTGHVRTVSNLGSFVLPIDHQSPAPETVDDVSRRVDRLQAALAELDARVSSLEGPSREQPDKRLGAIDGG